MLFVLLPWFGETLFCSEWAMNLWVFQTPDYSTITQDSSSGLTGRAIENLDSWSNNLDLDLEENEFILFTEL